MESKLFKLNKKDFLNGALSAIIAGIMLSLYSITSQVGFSFYNLNCYEVLDTAFSAGISAFVGFLGHSFVSDSTGTVLGNADNKSWK